MFREFNKHEFSDFTIITNEYEAEYILAFKLSPVIRVFVLLPVIANNELKVKKSCEPYFFSYLNDNCEFQEINDNLSVDRITECVGHTRNIYNVVKHIKNNNA